MSVNNPIAVDNAGVSSAALVRMLIIVGDRVVTFNDCSGGAAFVGPSIPLLLSSQPVAVGSMGIKLTGQQDSVEHGSSDGCAAGS